MATLFDSQEIKTIFKSFDVLIKNGKFYHLSGDEISVKENTTGILIISKDSLIQQKKKPVVAPSVQKIVKVPVKLLSSGEVLRASLAYYQGKKLLFKFRILEDLYVVRKGPDKLPVAENCKCEVFELENPGILASGAERFKPFTVSSLNQIYTTVSTKYRKDKGKHTEDIYYNFTTEWGESLDSLRRRV